MKREKYGRLEGEEEKKKGSSSIATFGVRGEMCAADTVR